MTDSRLSRGGEELVFDHVTCRYGRRTVVHDACLHAGAGEHVALIGANGSGKTTLLRAALGLHPATAGSIVLGGRDAGSRRGWADRRREIAWMPQRRVTGRFPLLVKELLASSSSPGEAARVAHDLGLAGLLQRPLDTLSGGQLQRAFLARAIGAVHGGATALLADEPTAALDFDAKAGLPQQRRGDPGSRAVNTTAATPARLPEGARQPRASSRLKSGRHFNETQPTSSTATQPLQRTDCSMLSTISRAALIAALLACTAVAAGCGSGSDTPKNLDATVRVVKAMPAGGVQSLKARKGGRIHLIVQSDTADEIHIHGYDIHNDVPRNGSATFDFAATIDGQFVIELEDHKEQIAKLVVEP